MKIYLHLVVAVIIFSISSKVDAQVWSNTGLSFPSIVYTIVDYNGTLQVGGTFSIPNEMRAQSVYNSDLYTGGTNGGASTHVYKNGLSIGAVSGNSQVVFAIAVYNNELYAAGSFTSINGVTANNIARWNGTMWAAVSTGIGTPNNIINSLCVFNGDLYAGGWGSGELSKWNGSTWTVSGIFSENGGFGYIRCMAVYGNQLYVGGTFDTVNGITALNLAGYNGTWWSSAGDIGVAGAGNGVSAIAEYNGELFCGGNFGVAGGVSVSNIARGNGANWQQLGSGGTSGVVLALHVFNQSLYVGGNFTNAGGITVGNIAKWAPPCTPPAATITYQGPNTVCNPGGSLLLSANTGTGLTYQWKIGNSIIGGATLSTYLVGSSGGIFSVIVTNQNGCSATSAQVPINTTTSFANASPSGPISICSGSSAVLTAYVSTGYTYQWKNNGVAIAGATASTYSVTSAGNYSVDEKYGVCTKISNVVLVTVKQLPSAAITTGSPTTFCSGGSVVLNAVAAVNRTYQWKKYGTAISGATFSSYTAASSGTYKVIVTNTLTGCSKTSGTGTLVTVYSNPTATNTPQGPTAFCAGDSVQLKSNYNASYIYQWKRNNVNISGATANKYEAKTAGSYKVKVTNNNGCTVISNTISVAVPCREEETDSGTDKLFLDCYPNPVAGFVHIKIDAPESKQNTITICDMPGKILMKTISENNEFTWDCSELQNGIYVISLLTSDGIYKQKKIIIQN